MQIDAKTLEPDAEQMFNHLEHLYGGWLDGAQDGLVEICWRDAKSGKLSRAQLFKTDELEEAAEKAAEVNRVAGQNVYVGYALRKPDTCPFARASDDDFLALPADYCDLDDKGAADAVRERTKTCRPTAVVVTGRKPWKRAQLMWRRETPERDTTVSRQRLRGIAEALGGDVTVVNPSRVMRLGGSIAWPVKEGREVELTEYIEMKDGRAASLLPGEIEKAYPPSTVHEMPASAAPAEGGGLHIGNEFQLKQIMDAARADKHWHDNLVRLVGHWLNAGLVDEEILTMTEPLTLAGYAIEQTRREVTKMIDGGRKKWNIPEPDGIIKDDGPALFATPLGTLDPATIPPRPWLFGHRYLKGYVTVTVAPPGVGKSTLTIQEALAIATGQDWAGQDAHETGKVWVYNNEDDRDELHRRIAAAAKHMEIDLAQVADRLYINTGAERPFLVARENPKTGDVTQLPDVAACIEEIRRLGISLFVVDPFAETHHVSENSNEAIRAVGAMYRDIAQQTNAAVSLVHHTRKLPAGSSEGHVGNMDSGRGASALMGIARVVDTLFGMSQKDADRLDIEPEDRGRYIRLDGAKANMSLITGEAIWFRRATVILPNGPKFQDGDHVGVLEPTDFTTKERRAASEREKYHDTLAADIAPLLKDGKRSLLSLANALRGPGKRLDGYSETKARNDLEAAFRHPRDIDGDRQIWIERHDDGHKTKYLKIGPKND